MIFCNKNVKVQQSFTFHQASKHKKAISGICSQSVHVPEVQSLTIMQPIRLKKNVTHFTLAHIKLEIVFVPKCFTRNLKNKPIK